jgi:hypothetical protein
MVPEAVSMLAMKRFPLFRTALLSLAVLVAHTAHAANRPTTPAAPPCSFKVAAAQPDPEQKPLLGSKRIVRPSFLASHHSLCGGFSSFALAQTACFPSAYSVGQTAVARWTAHLAQQCPPFVLRV